MNEPEAKKLNFRVMMAKYCYSGPENSMLNDFTVIDDYSFGKNLMILANASCLMDTSLNNQEIFKNVKLIVK